MVGQMQRVQMRLIAAYCNPVDQAPGLRTACVQHAYGKTHGRLRGGLGRVERAQQTRANAEEQDCHCRARRGGWQYAVAAGRRGECRPEIRSHGLRAVN
eukprot:4863554-Pleurochrysis_carterae.AAC.4